VRSQELDIIVCGFDAEGQMANKQAARAVEGDDLSNDL
jgi:hypothetical protein